MTREELREWLDRKPPPGSWRDFEEPTKDERPWEELELQRVKLEPERDAQLEAGHA